MVSHGAQAVVLAAGEAQRLRPLTLRRPKGMLLVGGKPILQWLLETLKAVGVDRAILVVGVHAEKVQTFFKDGKDFGMRLRYANQAKATGTADALRLSLPLIDPKGPVIVLPGDNYLTAKSLAPLLKDKRDRLLVAPPKRAATYGVPRLQGDRVKALKDESVPAGASHVSTGVLHASRSFLDALAATKYRAIHDLDGMISAFVRGGGTMLAVPAEGPWEDVTVPWDILALNELILDALPAGERARRRAGSPGRVIVGEKTIIAPSARLIGPLTIGRGCTIADHTVIGPYVSIRNNSSVGAHSEIRRSILNNNVQVDSRCLLRGSILDDGVRVGPDFACHEESTPHGLVGCVLGADSVIGPDCRAASGTLVDPDRKIPAGTHLSPGA